MTLDIWVVLATSGRPDLVHRTLESLAQSHLPDAYRGTYVVENGEKRGVERIVRSFRSALNAEYRHTPLPNKCKALNLAVAELANPLILFTDDDVRFGARTLEAYAAVAKDGPDGRFFGGPLMIDYDVPPSNWLVEFLPRSAKGWRWEDGREGVDRVLFLGANWAAFARDVVAAGGFDPSIGPDKARQRIGDETDMQRRLLSIGLCPEYVADAPMWHYVPPERCSPKSVIRHAYRIGFSQGFDYTHEGAQHWLGLPRWLFGDCARSVARGLRGAVTFDRASRFHAYYDFARSYGFVRGRWGSPRTERPRIPTEGPSP